MLISPPFSGFNILAWTLPFVVLFVAGYFIFIYIRKREEPQTEVQPVTEKHRDREELIETEILKASIEEEMKKYR